MHLRFLFFLLCWLISLPLYADEGKCLLWQAQSESNTVYLLGSIHMMREREYPLDRCVDNALKEAEHLVVELNVLEIDPIEMGRRMQQLGMLPPGERIDSQLSEETLQQLQKLESLPDNYQLMRPWLLTLTLTLQHAAQLGYRADLGVDYYLLGKAQGVKPIESLETLELQLAALSGDTPQQQDLMLKMTLEQLGELESYIDTLSGAWRNGDAETIYQMMAEPKETYPQLASQFQRQVTDRNKQMAEKIFAMLGKKEDYLVVIGAGHLGGEEGVLNLLRQQGVALVQQPKLGRSMFD